MVYPFFLQRSRGERPSGISMRVERFGFSPPFFKEGQGVVHSSRVNKKLLCGGITRSDAHV